MLIERAVTPLFLNKNYMYGSARRNVHTGRYYFTSPYASEVYDIQLNRCISPVVLSFNFFPGGCWIFYIINFSTIGNYKAATFVCLSHIHTASSHAISILTHWGRATHICVNKLTIIASDNGLSPGRRQAIIWNNAGILSIGLVGTNFSENLIEILTFSFKKMHLEVSSAKWRPFCLGLNVLSHNSPVISVMMTSTNRSFFPRHWPFVRESPMNSLRKGQLCGLFKVDPHKLFNKQSNRQSFDTTWRSCDVIIMVLMHGVHILSKCVPSQFGQFDTNKF